MIEFVYENGEIKVINHLNRRNEDPKLTDGEIEAIKILYSELNKLGFETKELKEERRALDYISIVYENYDFLRIKIGKKSKWISIDMCAANRFNSDERTSHVKNKNQRHWKFPLNEIEDLKKYIDIISESFKKAIEFETKQKKK